MKKQMNRFLGFALAGLLLIAVVPQKVQAQDVSVSYQSFYDNLSPYGQWVSDPQYGNVWVPNEGGDFRPYGSRGHWVMTDYGNTWVSEDPWGWACYHYGRWTYDPYYGWVWIPGYEWAPAWVSWRFGGGFCGWAPLGPGSVGVGYYCPDSWWVFVGPQYMYDQDCYHHWRGPGYNTTYIQQTTIINNYYVDNSTHVRYNYGPRADAIQQVTHQPVQVYRVSQTNRPGAANVSGNRVSLYRPAVNQSTVRTARPENVINAPRAIGKPQAATSIAPNRQPQFRQDIPKLAPTQRPQPATQQRPEPAQQSRPQPASQQRPEPAQQSRPQPAPQQRPEPVQQPRPQPMPQQRSEPVQQPRPQPMPQPRPEPVQQPRPQPMPQQRPEPVQQPRPQPMPQQRPEPVQQPRPQPMPQPRPQQMQQPRPQPMPQQRPQPQREEPREGGRR